MQGKTGVRLVVANYTPVPRPDYRIGVPHAGRWHQLLNSVARHHWGSGMGNSGAVESMPVVSRGRPHAAESDLAPLSILNFKLAG